MYYFISDEDRAAQAMLEDANIRVDRAMLAYETTKFRNELKLREIQNRVFAEDGSFGDLCDAFEEAAQQQEEQKKGVLQNVWDAIQKLIEKIKTTLFGKGECQQQEMDANEHKVLGKLGELANKVTQFTSNHKVLTTLAGLAVTLLAIRKLKNNKSGKKENVSAEEQTEAEKNCNIITSAFHKVLGVFKKDNTDNTDNESGMTESGATQETLGIVQWAQNLINKGKKKVTETAENVKNKVTGKGKEDVPVNQGNDGQNGANPTDNQGQQGQAGGAQQEQQKQAANNGKTIITPENNNNEKKNTTIVDKNGQPIQSGNKK